MTVSQIFPVFHDLDSFEEYVFCRLSSNLVLSDVFLMIRLELGFMCVGGVGGGGCRILKRWQCPAHNIKSEVHDISMTYHW